MRWLTILRQWFAEWFGTVQPPRPTAHPPKICPPDCGACDGPRLLTYQEKRDRLTEFAPDLLTEHDAGRLTIEQAWGLYVQRGFHKSKLYGKPVQPVRDPGSTLVMDDPEPAMIQTGVMPAESWPVDDGREEGEEAPAPVPFPTVEEVQAVKPFGNFAHALAMCPSLSAPANLDSGRVIVDPTAIPVPYVPEPVQEAPAPHDYTPPSPPPSYDSGSSGSSYDSGSSSCSDSGGSSGGCD